ncbi:MAG: PTS sugar transporter subunit IIA [Kiritimatiellae bacterium]|nr:PTS sugar transporter subunit IIA [Kiritimatiellia bacterium]MBR1835863.1 PTS sugar transporter subunit IIA [Kiritimatiellia bacterium]
MNDISANPAAFLADTVFVPDIGATDKQGVLSAIAEAAAAAGLFPANRKGDVLKALSDREKTMSTGMQYGVAIPHARTDAVSGLATLVALSPSGVPFDALDGEPSTIFIATLSPPADANSHIRFLAAVTRQLSSRRVRETLLAARTKDDLVAAFSDGAV